MPTQYQLSLLSILCLFLIIFSCKKDDLSEQEEYLEVTKNTDPLSSEKRAALPPQNTVSTRAPVSYTAQICSDNSFTGQLVPNGINSAVNWNLYSFYGEAGETISIDVQRLSCEVDPALSIFFGTITHSTGVTYYQGGNDMEFLAFADDEIFASCATCASHGDPALASYTLPYTGDYTLAVFDVAGCGNGLNYELTATGINCESDSESEESENIIIGDCDTGVENQILENGKTMSELIEECRLSHSNFKDFKYCVKELLKIWKKEKLICKGDKKKIRECIKQMNSCGNQYN